MIARAKTQEQKIFECDYLLQTIKCNKRGKCEYKISSKKNLENSGKEVPFNYCSREMKECAVGESWVLS
jgi:hypothetical protein